MLSLPVNAESQIRIVASDGATNLYGRILIYNAAGTLTDTLSAGHLAGGIYTAAWTPTTEGLYTSLGQLFTNVGLTVDAGYDLASEDLDVNSVKTNILKILGLQHNNAVLTGQTYDGSGNLLTATLKCYDTKAHALLAGVTGLLFTYSITATYNGSHQLTNYTVVLE